MQRRSKKALRHISAVVSLSLMVHATPVLSYDNSYAETPSAGYMIADAVFARPLMAAGTAVGLGAFVVSLPFSFLGGNVGEAANQLVLKPAAHTFLRCLGCKHFENKWLVPKFDRDEFATNQASDVVVDTTEWGTDQAKGMNKEAFEEAVAKEAQEI